MRLFVAVCLAVLAVARGAPVAEDSPGEHPQGPGDSPADESESPSDPIDSPTDSGAQSGFLPNPERPIDHIPDRIRPDHHRPIPNDHEEMLSPEDIIEAELILIAALFPDLDVADLNELRGQAGKREWVAGGIWKDIPKEIREGLPHGIREGVRSRIEDEREKRRRGERVQGGIRGDGPQGEIREEGPEGRIREGPEVGIREEGRQGGIREEGRQGGIREEGSQGGIRDEGSQGGIRGEGREGEEVQETD